MFLNAGDNKAVTGNWSWHWKFVLFFEVKKGFIGNDIKWHKTVLVKAAILDGIGTNCTVKNGDHPRTGLSIRGGTIPVQFGSCWHGSFWEVFWLIHCLNMLYFLISLKHKHDGKNLEYMLLQQSYAWYDCSMTKMESWTSVY